jgi:hypothetical protein
MAPMALLVGDGSSCKLFTFRCQTYKYSIEGAATIGIAILGYFFVLGFPDQLLASTRRQGFTTEELNVVLDRIDRDRGDAEPDPLTFKKVLKHMSQWPFYVYGFMFWTSSVPIYAFAYFIQTILGTMGYTTAQVFLLCAPPYLLSMFWTLAIAYLADRSKIRMPWMVLNAAITLTGLLLTAYCNVSLLPFRTQTNVK